MSDTSPSVEFSCVGTLSDGAIELLADMLLDLLDAEHEVEADVEPDVEPDSQ